MNFIGLIAIYFVTWFISLLGILPFGVERNNHPEAGHDAGAPVKAMMWRKVAVATVVAGVITFSVWLVAELELIQLRPDL
jgi:predicted secreted protein